VKIHFSNELLDDDVKLSLPSIQNWYLQLRYIWQVDEGVEIIIIIMPREDSFFK
jgi:hypothetical protein